MAVLEQSPELLHNDHFMKTKTSLASRHVYLVSSGDLRLSANQKCWPEQAKMEAVLAKALKAEGWTVVRAHPYRQAEGPRLH